MEYRGYTPKAFEEITNLIRELPIIFHRSDSDEWETIVEYLSAHIMFKQFGKLLVKTVDNGDGTFTHTIT